MEPLHINQCYNLAEKYAKHFSFDREELVDKAEKLSYEDYQHLLSLWYNRRINEMRTELIKLGIKIN